MNIPIYRAKKIDSDEYIEGFFLFQEESRVCIEICQIYNSKIRATYEVDISTLAIHFPDMIDNQGNKIFASLREDGKGGDIVISKSYPFYGDAPEITDSSGKCEELNYKGLLLFTSTGCYMDYIKVSDRVRGCAIGCAIEDFNKFKSIGIQE